MQWGEVVVWTITEDSMLSSVGLAFNDDFAILPGMSHKTRDFLIRGLPVELANKVKIAAGLHGQSMQGYVQALLAEHVKALEKKGVTLDLPKRIQKKKTTLKKVL
jgi:plasmid stability protein